VPGDVKKITFSVIKADGTRQIFDKNKVIRTCMKMGADIRTANVVAQKIENRLYEGITTKTILRMIFSYLRKYKPEVSHVFDLRRGLSLMAPKPEFELFVQTLLKYEGFEVESNQILKGKCVGHETDAVVKKDGVTYFVEAKHHKNYHSLTGLDESRIARAILEDTTESYELGINRLKIDRAMIITNTRYSNHAIQYGNCRNILQIGWSEPEKFSLQKIIEEKKLYPLSCLKDVRLDVRMQFVFAGIVLIRQLLEDDNIDSTKISLPKETVNYVKQKAQNSTNAFAAFQKNNATN
jgi:hypothetical protein